MTTTASDAYVLGESAFETQRLLAQSDLYAAATDDGLRRAGIRPGMRVLDVGAGTGGVTLLAARHVGPGGSVTALDVSGSMLDVVTARAAAAGLTNVATALGDLADEVPGSYDAVTGRLILIHLPDPAAAIERLVRVVRPGGIVAFFEYAVAYGGQQPPGRRYTETLAGVVETLRRAGRPVNVGLEVPRLLRGAGLVDVQAQVGAVVGEADNGAISRVLAETARSLHAAADRLGVDLPGAADPVALAGELLAEARALDAVTIPPLLVAAWGRVPTGR